MISYRHLLGISTIACAALAAQAGNIPQHSLSTGGDPYTPIEGSQIYCSWESGGTIGLFPEGEKAAPYEAEGFPIGFDFKFGGRWVDQFIATSAGDIYLGDGKVVYDAGAPFRISMSPVLGGVLSSNITYAVSGEENERVCTVQFANTVLNEPALTKGLYNMQIRLYEADGHVEVAFQELRAPESSLYGFDLSLNGWDSEDVLVVTADDIASTPKISSYQRAYMLDSESYVHWNNSTGGPQKSATYVFTPEKSTTAPKGAPTNLTLTQEEKTLNISLSKARDARATVVLWSTEPITSADLPSDGETFLAGPDCTIGNAHAIYYGPKRDISLSVTGIEDGKDYYVTAISANGYPAFNVDNMAEAVYRTAQSAPHMLLADAKGPDAIRVECGARDNVIVAVTSEAHGQYAKGYFGRFGIPAADAKVGDQIEGGGTVIYVGEPKAFDYACEPNRIAFFRAWTVSGDRLSSNWIDAYAVPDVSLPYAPGIEYYPMGELIEKWSAAPTGQEFAAYYREYYKDRAVYGVAPAGYEPISLITPQLPLDTPVRVTFEFAMETKRDAAATPDSGGVLLPQGCEPGWFGDQGYLRIKTGSQIHKTVTSYEGTMVGFDDSGFNDYSSTFVPVSVDIPAQNGNTAISLEVAAQKDSRIFFRNIVVTPLAEAPKAPEAAPADLNVTEDTDGIMTIKCHRAPESEYTLVLFSEQPMGATEIPEDGHLFTVGQTLGNATVLYFGNDEEVECSTAYMKNGEPVFIFADYDTDYFVRAISGSANPMYNTSVMAEMTYHSLGMPGAVEEIGVAEGEHEIFTVTGIRLTATDVKSLPAGLYIIDGRKQIIR